MRYYKEAIKIQAILDTNIIFAGLFSKKGVSFQVIKAIVAQKIKPVLSVTLLFEYEDVLKRNSKKLDLNFKEIDAFLDNLCNLSTTQTIHYLWRPFLTDQKDDHILELAVASQVRKITTFNIKDFKGVEQFGVNVITPKQLLEEIKWER